MQGNPHPKQCTAVTIVTLPIFGRTVNMIICVGKLCVLTQASLGLSLLLESASSGHLRSLSFRHFTVGFTFLPRSLMLGFIVAKLTISYCHLHIFLWWDRKSKRCPALAHRGVGQIVIKDEEWSVHLCWHLKCVTTARIRGYRKPAF